MAQMGKLGNDVGEMGYTEYSGILGISGGKCKLIPAKLGGKLGIRETLGIWGEGRRRQLWEKGNILNVRNTGR